MSKRNTVVVFFAFSMILFVGCKHTESSSKAGVSSSILLRESTVAEVNGLRVGCASVFQGADEAQIRATLVVMDGSAETSKRVQVGDTLGVGKAQFLVTSIREGESQSFGSVEIQRK